MHRWASLIVALGFALLRPAMGPSFAEAVRYRFTPEMVRLRDVDATIMQDIRYATVNNFTRERVPGYERGECVLLRFTANALKQVQADLQSRGLGLKVYDCFRPMKAVEAFVKWSKTMSDDGKVFYPRVRKDRLLREGYISQNSKHSNGSAVDVTLVRLTSILPNIEEMRITSCVETAPGGVEDGLDMGTTFDCFDPKSATASSGLTSEQRINRNTLLGAMQRRGFRNYWREWWHFDYPGSVAY